MTSIQDLKVCIVDFEHDVVRALEGAFIDIPNVDVAERSIEDFYEEHKDEIDCLVSPANAFGYMTGGYDAGLSDIFGWDFQLEVQDYIRMNYYGEQPVGSSFIIDTPIKGVRLIHTPTMRYPSVIKDPEVVYHCMRSTLICALEHDVRCIVIPVFGGRCGKVAPKTAAKMMREAYLQIAKRKGPTYDI